MLAGPLVGGGGCGEAGSLQSQGQQDTCSLWPRVSASGDGGQAGSQWLEHSRGVIRPGLQALCPYKPGDPELVTSPI